MKNSHCLIVSVAITFVCFVLVGCSGSNNNNISTGSGTSFQATQVQVFENASDGDISVVLSREDSVGDLAVNVVIDGGTATPGQDFVLAGSSSFFVVIPDGAATQEFVLGTLLNDGLAEGRETILLRLSGTYPGTVLGSASTLTIDIEDDDGPSGGVVQFAQSESTVSENEGSFLLKLTRTGGSSGTVVASIVATGGSASEGTDFSIPLAAYGWLDGDTADKTRAVTLTDDTLPEGTEDIEFSVNVVLGDIAIGTLDSSTLNIIDDDVGAEVKLLFQEVNVLEGSSVSVVAVRQLGSGGAVTVDLVDMGTGSATQGTDYAFSSNPTANMVTFTWANGEIGPKSAEIMIHADNLLEPLESIDVELTNVTGNAVLAAPNAATVRIADANSNNVGDFRLTTSLAVAEEGDGLVQIMVERTNGSLGTAVVGYSIVAGTATSGSDFIEEMGTVAFPSGAVGPFPIDVSLVDDAILENVETIIISLTSVPAASVLAGPSVATLIVQDDDDPWQQIYSATNANLNDLFFDVLSGIRVIGDQGTLLEFVNDSLVPTPGTSMIAEDLFAGACSPSSLATFPGCIVAGASGAIYHRSPPMGGPFVSVPSGSVATLNAMIYLANGNLPVRDSLAVGDSGTILKSDTNGTWTSLNSGVVVDLNSAAKTGTNTIYAVGDGGTIIMSMDAGQTWNQQTSGTTENLQDLFFKTPNLGWVVGDNGTILRTTNGGQFWQAQVAGSFENLNAIDGENFGQLVCIVGDNGLILSTDNAWIAWQPQATASTEDLLDIYMKVLPGYVVGTNGEFRRITQLGN